MQVISVSRNKGGWSDSPMAEQAMHMWSCQAVRQERFASKIDSPTTFKDTNMNIGQMFQKGLDCYNAAMAGNYMLALAIAFQMAQAILDNLPPAQVAAMLSTRPVAHGEKSLDELLDSLKTTCEANVGMQSTDAGSVISILLPLLQPLIAALLKKWLGL